ncbi:MAG: CoA pyrophosphatase [Candidatus Eisenbacteria bacterium]|nr:CoA pyrophosphatase [Candidatus Eisenbacteria bacterium]MBU1948653.1 CoA pyrophosphatase [Candidatus Eisenbacteria bacterium]
MDWGESPHTRTAATLALFYEKEKRLRLLLTMRTETLDSHRGQISLPGGGVEPGETFEQAALREGQEEVAIDPACVSILGRLTPLHVPVSGFLVHPIVAFCERPPELKLNPTEVDCICEAPLDHLLESSSVVWRLERRKGLELFIPYLTFEGWMIWGATAMMLSELFTILGWPGPPNPPPIEKLLLYSDTDALPEDRGTD